MIGPKSATRPSRGGSNGWPGNDGPIVVTAEAVAVTGGRGRDCGGPGVRITIRDWGNGVDPSSLPARPRDPQVPGGLGMICLAKMMDEVAYAPQPDGMLLMMVK